MPSALVRVAVVAGTVLGGLIALPSPAPAAVTPVTAINFQPAASSVPAGYTADTGAAFDATRGYGWVRQDSLGTATHTPLDLTANTRDRARAGIDPRLNTIIHLQYGDVPPPLTNGVTTAGAWEYTTPPGIYTVTVTVGDQPAYNSSHVIRVEGVTAVDHFVSTAAAEFRTASVTVAVTDGRITLDAVGGTNTKLASVTVGRVVEPSFAVNVNFSDAATAAPAGYVRDAGDAYGDRGGGLTYGWVVPGTTTPLSLLGNGRNRGAASDPDVRLATLVHAQLPAGSPGVPSPGSWEVAVPDGSYDVTVAVGDAGSAIDSVHYLSIEDQNAVAAFVPTAAVKHATATRTVTVADGRLTPSAAAGTNTKLDYVSVASVAGAAIRPSVRTSTPANLATGVDPDTSVVDDLRLPAGGVDPASLTATSVTLTRVADRAAVPANVITSGGGDVVNLSPKAPLAPNTLYRFDVTSAVRDVAGNAFLPYSTVFTTGTGSTNPTPVEFQQVPSGAVSAAYTSVVKGPDGRLYAATLDGHLYRYTIGTDGTLSAPTVIDTVRTHATAAGLAGAPNRTVIGLAFDPASTPTNPILWISDNYEFVGAYDVPDWSSRIARLTGPNLATYTEVVTNLPRSVKDHETNSLAFGPDGALYFTQGANNAMGDADPTWGNRPEHRLNAAVLRLDPTKLSAALPLDVKTEEGGSYDPAAPGAPLTLYATGVRNAFDLVWHRNGHLYTPTNGSAAGGNTPATPSPLPPGCPASPAVPAITNNPQAETDYVFDVKPGRYYGHPNPTRCQWVLAGGNPTAGADPFQVDGYPVGTLPDANLDLPDIYDAGLHASADGAIEYVGGALDGKLLYLRYSSGQDIVTFDVAASGALSNRTTGITGFAGFNQPLDLTEDTATGNLYVTELGASRITLVRPVTSTGPAALQVPLRLVFSTVKSTTSAPQALVVRNTGGSALTVTSLSAPSGFVLAGAPVLPCTVPAAGVLDLAVTAS